MYKRQAITHTSYLQQRKFEEKQQNDPLPHFGAQTLVKTKYFQSPTTDTFTPQSVPATFIGAVEDLGGPGGWVVCHNEAGEKTGRIMRATTINVVADPLPEAPNDWSDAGWTIKFDPDDRPFWEHESGDRSWLKPAPVSYTHLTLPTNREV